MSIYPNKATKLRNTTYHHKPSEEQRPSQSTILSLIPTTLKLSKVNSQTKIDRALPAIFWSIIKLALAWVKRSSFRVRQRQRQRQRQQAVPPSCWRRKTACAAGGAAAATTWVWTNIRREGGVKKKDSFLILIPSLWFSHAVSIPDSGVSEYTFVVRKRKNVS